jgi:camelysin-like metallo-endopeptidase
MRKLMRKKRVLAGLAAVLALAIAGVAYAYFTSSGTGSGSATVGSANTLTIDPVTITGTLYPGDTTGASVSFTVNNPGSSSVKVDKVVADTSAGTNGISGLPSGCSASDFHFADVTVGQEIAAGGTYLGSGTLTMDDSGSNQDACQGATPTLNLKVDDSGI